MKPCYVITCAADFIEGLHWRRLTKLERGKSPWKAVYLVDVFMPRLTGLKHPYRCWQGGRLWGELRPDGILMKAGYAWNFNTFAPDFAGKAASGGHDLLFQFSGCFYFPRMIIDRKWADDFYYHFCERWIAWAYRAGLFAGSWWAWGNQPLNGEFVEPVS